MADDNEIIFNGIKVSQDAIDAFNRLGCMSFVIDDTIRNSLMSNEYREWENDRKEEAWSDIIRIAELVEKGLYNDPEDYTLIQIKDILVEGGWI